jgi:glycerophosphoryl diester phosphodiesterase
MFLKIGHRGAKAYKPENTLSSFDYALKSGFLNAVEFDVRKTKDDKLVVIHDAKVDKTTNGKGYVNELTLSQIKQLNANGEKIPTLEEVLDFLDKKCDKILVELKEVGYEEKVLKEIEKRGLKDRTIIISFHEEALNKVRELDSKIETGFIYVKYKNPIKKALELKANYLLPLYHFVHSADVKKAHENGLKVIIWTINKREEALTYKEKGVDGIATDKPEVLEGF